MSDHRHTPGPWKSVKSNWDDSWTVDAENDVVCFFSYLREEDHVTVNLDNDETNARLIAAAPALLEALEAAVSQYDGFPDEVLAEIAPDWLAGARDALKLARGE